MYKKVFATLLGSLMFLPVMTFAEEQHVIESNTTAQTSVVANISSGYTVSFPKRVDISSKTAKETEVMVLVKGDIAGDETLKITPDTSVIMENQEVNSTKEDVTVTVTYTKNTFSWDEIDGDGYQSTMVFAGSRPSFLRAMFA